MKLMEYLARALSLLWAGFWTFFFIAESVAWHTPVGLTAIWAAAGVTSVVLAVLAWRWEVAGGWVLITTGLLAALAYGIRGPRQLSVVTRLTTLMAFGIPPVAAGALFLMHHRRIGRRSRACR